MAPLVSLVELDCYHVPSGHTHRWHLCTGPSAYQSTTADTPAGLSHLPVVERGAVVSVSVTSWGRVGGASRVQLGDVAASNTRDRWPVPRHAVVLNVTTGQYMRVALGVRPLDALLPDAGQYVVRSVKERLVELGAPLSTAVTLWRGRAGVVKPAGRAGIVIPTWDPALDLDNPIVTATYAGTGGWEGPAEMKGTTRELAWGHCPIVPPTYMGIIAGFHSWSASGGAAIQGVPRAWDRAYPYTLVSGDPAGGQYSVDLSTGRIRTGGGSKPESFRCEVLGITSAGAWPHTIGQLAGWLATRSGVVTGANTAGIDAPARTSGLWIPAGDGRTYRDALDKLCASVPRGHWWIGLDGAMTAGRLPRADDGPPVRTIRRSTGETTGLVPIETDRVVPAKQAVVLWGQNPNPETNTAAQASAGDVALWSKAWREAPSAESAAVAAAWGSAARVERIETAFALQADAEAEAPAWAAELSAVPQAYELPLRDQAPGLWIGSRVRVVDDVPGFYAGANLIVYGRTIRDAGGGCTLFVVR